MWTTTTQTATSDPIKVYHDKPAYVKRWEREGKVAITPEGETNPWWLDGPSSGIKKSYKVK